MLQALLSSIASIKAQETQMNVIGSNLANVNTTAYKGSSVGFEDLVSQTLSGGSGPTNSLGGTNPIQLGLGVIVGSTTVSTQQGSLNSTNVPSDLAIQGNGFFAVSDGENISYTRDGQFSLDARGELVSSDTGQRLLGWEADSSGQISTSTQITGGSILSIPLGSDTAVQATQNVSFDGNLEAGSPSTTTWDTTAQVYDSLGTSHTVTIQFSNPASPPTAPPVPPAGATSSWNWTAYEGDPATGTAIGSSATAGNSMLYFDSNGQYVSGLAAGADNTITVPASGGATATAMNVNFGAISQLSSPSTVAFDNQDGYPPGVLNNYSIGNNGVITGIFSNGFSRSLGQVSIATFANPAGLSSIGSNLWGTTVNSGSAVMTTPAQGSAGTLNAGYLEQSNVDIGDQFTNLIVTQRGFEANTKVVTAIDQMLQDLVNMKQ